MGVLAGDTKILTHFSGRFFYMEIKKWRGKAWFKIFGLFPVNIISKVKNTKLITVFKIWLLNS
jgi:hypothetical protein